jgi:hypothetical protein
MPVVDRAHSLVIMCGGRPIVARALGACVALASCVASAAPAMAASWRVIPSPGDGALGAISCVSTNACFAVGVQADHGGRTPPHGGVALAERWNGTNWTIQRTPVPAGSTVSELLDVTCTSRSFCIAVGTFSSTPRQAPNALVERWDGSRWSIQRVPKRFFASGVSCTSTVACTAVGGGPYTDGIVDSNFGFRAVVERWNGSRWTMQQTPKLGLVGLAAVSCTSATACVAVGQRSSASDTMGNVTLAERWNGSRWSIQKTPTPGSLDDWLWGISCPSATACMAVGDSIYGQGTGVPYPVLESWTDGRWSIQSRSLFTPFGGPPATLNSVSCRSARSCTAVGQISTTTYPYSIVALALGWNGRNWSRQLLPDTSPPGSYASLTGVSCRSATTCTAVGSVITSSGQRLTLVEQR